MASAFHYIYLVVNKTFHSIVLHFTFCSREIISSDEGIIGRFQLEDRVRESYAYLRPYLKKKKNRKYAFQYLNLIKPLTPPPILDSPPPPPSHRSTTFPTLPQPVIKRLPRPSCRILHDKRSTFSPNLRLIPKSYGVIAICYSGQGKS